MAYRTWGTDGDPPVILLHSLGETSGTWRTLGLALSDRHHVIAPDLRGHGRSTHADDDSVELMSQDVLGFIDLLQLDRVALIGHSLGAMLAYVLAPSVPTRIGAMVLEEPPPPVPPRTARPLPSRSDVVRCDWAAVEAIYDQRNHPDPGWLVDMAKIEAPTLVVAGGDESHLDQGDIVRAAKRIPRCDVVTVPAGHHVHRCRPDEFRAAVEPFLVAHLPPKGGEVAAS